MEEEPRPRLLDLDPWLPTQCHVLQPLIPRPQLRLIPPDTLTQSGLTGGGGEHPLQRITCTVGVLIISVVLTDLIHLTSSEIAAPADLREHLPIRLSVRCTKAQNRATPGDGYCGLHALLRITRGMAPEAKQKRDLSAFQTFITESLLPRAQSDDWPFEPVVPHYTREYLHRILFLLTQGKKMADSVDHMPMEAMQLLIHRHPGMAALWTPDRNKSEELWLTTIAGFAPPLTMALVLSSMAGLHIGFSNDHFFETAVLQSSVTALIDKTLA
jgi:hypothetical protein